MMAMTLTVLTGPWDIGDVRIWKRTTIGNLIHSHPKVTAQPVTVVFPKGQVVLSHTGHHAGAAAGTLIQIDHHAVL
jgi:hypothetical protein